MGLFPDTSNCGFRMRRECREPFPRHRIQKKQPVSDPCMHHVMHAGIVNQRWKTFPAHAQPAILSIWQESQWKTHRHLQQRICHSCVELTVFAGENNVQQKFSTFKCAARSSVIDDNILAQWCTSGACTRNRKSQKAKTGRGHGDYRLHDSVLDLNVYEITTPFVLRTHDMNQGTGVIV